jgi:hypothetical protein
LGGLSLGMDDAADSSTGFSPTARNPKKRGPFHAVPVMARAMVERLV